MKCIQCNVESNALEQNGPGCPHCEDGTGWTDASDCPQLCRRHADLQLKRDDESRVRRALLHLGFSRDYSHWTRDDQGIDIRIEDKTISTMQSLNFSIWTQIVSLKSGIYPLDPKRESALRKLAEELTPYL